MSTPHETFNYFRADEVAECWPVGDSLYFKLWNTIVPLQEPFPNLEDSGPHDHVGHESLSKHWHLLTEEEQLFLNRLAKAAEGENVI